MTLFVILLYCFPVIISLSTLSSMFIRKCAHHHSLPTEPYPIKEEELRDIILPYLLLVAFQLELQLKFLTLR